MNYKDFVELLAFENEAYALGYNNVAGIDEAGRGPLAGPVVAAACIVPRGVILDGVDDSKKLSPKKREQLFEQLTNDDRIKYGVGIVDHKKIDEINILQATILAMNTAVDNLSCPPDYLLVDGLKLNNKIPSQKIIKGDSRSQSIAAASIIAKVTRDKIMLDYHNKWPEYGFNKHKGYGTRAHIAAIMQHGPSPIHRLTFAPIKNIIKEVNYDNK